LKLNKAKIQVKCFMCGKLGYRSNECYLDKQKSADKSLVEPRNDNKKGGVPRLPYLGSLETLKAKPNGKVDAEAVLDSAASNTFVPQELVDRLGVKVGV
jgi:hypothetical protein